jgi:hypothetical protein
MFFAKLHRLERILCKTISAAKKGTGFCGHKFFSLEAVWIYLRIMLTLHFYPHPGPLPRRGRKSFSKKDYIRFSSPLEKMPKADDEEEDLG